jgi:hypothetical protein
LLAFCPQSFEPSKCHLNQSVRGRPECQRRRPNTTASELRLIGNTPKSSGTAGANVAKLTRFQQSYRQPDPAAVKRKRHLQHGRDGQRRIQFLVTNNLTLDLKRCSAEAWLIGPAARDFLRNTYLRLGRPWPDHRHTITSTALFLLTAREAGHFGTLPYNGATRKLG